MNILLSPDSYKHSLSSIEICNVMEESINQISDGIKVHKFPVSDGGEEFLDVFFYHDDTLEEKHYTVSDESGNKKEVIVGYCPKAKEVIIEVALVVGLVQLEANTIDIEKRTTFGIGELIIQVCNDLEVDSIVIGLGGTSTNDGGIGCLAALGMHLYDRNHNEVQPYLLNIEKVYSIEMQLVSEKVADIQFKLLCDVNNILLGEQGATYTYAPQKGANERTCDYLEHCMKKWTLLLNGLMNKTCHEEPGSGAAGGLGFAFLSCLHTEVVNGTYYLLERFHFHHYLNQCDYLITGEGKTDYQTLFGKVPISLAKIAKQYKVPTICISGAVSDISVVDMLTSGIIGLYGLAQRPMTLKDSLNDTKYLLQKITQSIVSTISYHK